VRTETKSSCGQKKREMGKGATEYQNQGNATPRWITRQKEEFDGQVEDKLAGEVQGGGFGLKGEKAGIGASQAKFGCIRTNKEEGS